jgi:hypothetical protein
LAKYKNESRTALIHGHRPEILFRFYREIVTEEMAELYYGIKPTEPAMEEKSVSNGKIVPFTAEEAA